MAFRSLHLVVVPLAVGFVMTAVAARAGEDDRTFSEKIMDGFYGTIRGTNMDNHGIDYRERSPLVVPPTLDLPPPVSANEAPVANWPKDPDERQRKAIIAAKKKAAPPPGRVLVTTAGALAQPINIAPPVDPQAGQTHRRGSRPRRGRRVLPTPATATARPSPTQSMTSRAICSPAAPRSWLTALA